MHVIVTCNYEKETDENSREKVETLFFPSYPYLFPWKPVFGSSRISNSKLSCMLSLPASMKMIRLRRAEKKCRHHFSHYKPMGIFFRLSRAAYSLVGGPIKTKFELVRALIHVIIACKYEKDQTKKQPRKSGDTVFSIITLSVTMETSGWVWPNFKLIQALMYLIITSKI